MVKCQNCGNINTTESNFCRFCGTRFELSQPASPQAYDYSPPRPYSWKTDEFQTQNEPRRATTAERPRPATSPFPANNQSYQQPLAQWQSNTAAPTFACPRCMNRYPPRHERRISTAGWIVFAVLLVTVFPFFWIGLLIKEDVWVCQACNARIA